MRNEENGEHRGDEENAIASHSDFQTPESGGLRFGSWLRLRRKELELTQEALGQIVGYSADMLRKIETGVARPSRQLAEVLAVRLDVPAEQRADFVRWARGEGKEQPHHLAPTAEMLPLSGGSLADLQHSDASQIPGTLRVPQLTVPPTPLIGRERELEQVQHLLTASEGRLVTLTGPGGVGKTRLAMQVSTRLSGDFRDGVVFVSLASVSNHALVAPALAQAVGIQWLDDPDRPLWSALKEQLRDKETLLVLDNFEHVHQAAPLLAELLGEAPGLKLLVTSRVVLRLRGEKELPVAPLRLPRETTPHGPFLQPDARGSYKDVPFAQLKEYEAVRLFCERGLDARPDFALTPANAPIIAAICRRLDGLPLAIELAAARTKILSPEALLARLENRLTLLTGGAQDLPARHRTLYDTMAWSYDLLEPAEQALFRRLSVFAGGCTLEAAEEVCNVDSSDILDTLTSLVDKSLLQQCVRGTPAGEPRFAMLETVREYAVRQLEESGEAEDIYRRYAEYFLRLAENSKSALRGVNQAAELNMLEREYTNLRATLEWSIAPAETKDEGRKTNVDRPSSVTLNSVDTAARICSALATFWRIRGYLSEGRAWIAAVLGNLGENENSQAHAQLLYTLGVFSTFQSDDSGAVPWLEKSLHIYRNLNDLPGMSLVLDGLAHLATHRGDLDSAVRLSGESMELRVKLGDRWGIMMSLARLADLANYRGEKVRGEGLFSKSLQIARELGDKGSIAGLLVSLGYVNSVRHEYERATEMVKEAAGLYQELGSTLGYADCLALEARIAYAQGRYERAVRLFAAAKARLDPVGVQLAPPVHTDTREYEHIVAALRRRLGEEIFARAWSSGQSPDAENL